MCGIAGYWGNGDEKILNSMIDSVSYRGPDDKGLLIEGALGLAQRRLSIIDLSSAGHQPMKNEDGSVTIVFNGEIYNFKDLKSELKKKHNFIGQSDTEVILHLYEEIGEQVFSKIHGMFAIAIYDKKRNKLLLARDRMGKKPLYWAVYDKTLIFGSELKVLMSHPLFKKEIDLNSLNKYFSFEYVPTPHSIFKNVFKLESGTFLTWDGTGYKKTVFWKPSFLPKNNNFENALEELDYNLFQSVKDRLVSDVPVGIFLSGGLDSSTIAYYAKKAGQNIKTFSIGFKEESFDESKYAREVAEYLGTDHYEKILSVEEGIKLVEEIGQILDEPVADSSITPTYILSKFARENVTVALGGDGGDELFCGYDTFLAHKLSPFYAFVPDFLKKKIIEPLVSMLPTSFSNISLDFKIKIFVMGFDKNTIYRDLKWMSSFSDSDKEKLFTHNVWSKVKNLNKYEDLDKYISSSDSKDQFDHLILSYEKLYMMDQVLVKVDRVSMMNSLEVRAPFLDTRVVEIANHLPTNFKVRGLERKYILKKLMEGRLPKNIIYRKKKGFGMPIGEWLRGPLKPLLEDYLSKDYIDKIGIFNYEYVSQIIAEHINGKKDNRKQIWTLLVFAIWWRKWLDM